MKRSPIRRDAQKAREWTQKSRGSLGARSAKKEAQRATERQIRERVFERDGGCVLAGVDGHVCVGPLTPHHRRKASSGGAYIEANLVALCSLANGDVEDHPAHYRERFPYLVVREGDWEFQRLGRRAARLA